MKTQQIGARIDAQIVAALDDYCSAQGVSRSDAITAALCGLLGIERAAAVVSQPDGVLARLEAIEARLTQIERQPATGAVSPPKFRAEKPVIPMPGGGRHDKQAALAMIFEMREMQTAAGHKPNNKVIADALNAAGLTQENGSAFTGDAVNRWRAREDKLRAK